VLHPQHAIDKARLLHQCVGAIVVALVHTESLSGSANGSEQGAAGGQQQHTTQQWGGSVVASVYRFRARLILIDSQ
jgi:hypothetical protein